ncbi:hypothetical protein BJY01DRAFT_176041 [Aspergillus pseudoustus]|uniref:Uncharacterized protein n=1 Tax=Aspergillus pseudoustus TaxID=1810923 RepID=A0ABR4K2H3_9EURO
MVELDGSGWRRVPYGNIVPIRIGVDAGTPGQETLSIGEIRVAIRAILFTISVPVNDDQWLIPVLVIAYLGHNRGRIIQAHAQINRDNGRGELILQYSPLFDFSQEPALNSLFAFYTLATPFCIRACCPGWLGLIPSRGRTRFPW